jgi:UDP-glucose 4-epimerase
LGEALRQQWAGTFFLFLAAACNYPSCNVGEGPTGRRKKMARVSDLPVASSEKTRWVLLLIWGNDYDTPDGTGIRDFIHVVDLASGHLSVLRHLKRPGVLTVNLGTGNGSSVLEVIRTFEAVSGRSVRYEIGERRAGDVAIGYADPTFAKEELGWKSARSLEQADHWRWQLQNPNGYRGIELLKVQERSRHADRHRRASAPEVLSKRRMVRPHERA